MNGHSAINGKSNGFTNGYANGDSKNIMDAEMDKAQKFLSRVSEMLITKGFKQGADVQHSKVVDFLQPDELVQKFDFEIGDKGENNDTLIKHCEDTIKYSVKTGHPYFFNQLYQGQDEYGLAGAWLTDTLNTSQYTFEVAPVFTLMEHSVLKKMRDLAGYTSGDGIFCPGGSVSNMYGLNLGRYKMFPEIKTEGMYALPKLSLFCSEQAHYSIKKGAALLGLGVNAINTVKCDGRGRMDVADLERALQDSRYRGETPYLVVATSGTTVIGAYDPLNAIADVCEREQLWMHVDCCWGGGVMLSRKYKHLMAGIERTDSLAWNPHKMMSTPLQCCAFLTRHEGLLQQCHSANAQYLFQQDKCYDVSYDTGDKSLQCGRRVDVFKLWLMWKSKGNVGFEQNINSIMDRSKYFTEKIKNHEGFRLVLDEFECTNICFWYIPPSLRNQPETSEWWEALKVVAPKIKERMMVQGTMLIGYQPLGDLVNFFRLVVGNFNHTDQDMDYVMNEIDRLGQDL